MTRPQYTLILLHPFGYDSDGEQVRVDDSSNSTGWDTYKRLKDLIASFGFVFRDEASRNATLYVTGCNHDATMAGDVCDISPEAIDLLQEKAESPVMRALAKLDDTDKIALGLMKF